MQVAKATTADGGSGNDMIVTGDGADKLNGGPGDDTIAGRGGKDAIVGDLGNDLVSGGPGDDTAEGGSGDDGLAGNDGDDDMSGGLLAAALVAGGTDRLDGGDGRDHIRSDPSAEDYHGGPGTDSMSYAYISTAVITVTLDDFPNDGKAGEQDNAHTDIEEVFSGPFAANLTGSTGDNTLKGNVGDDNLNGLAGSDNLSSEEGKDVIIAREDPPTPFRDTVACGTETDVAVVDLTDEVSNRASELCETVERAPVGQGPNVRIARTRIKANRRGRLRIPLSCPRRQTNGCKGTLLLKGSRSKSNFNLSPADKGVERLRLSRKQRRRLAKRRRGLLLRATARERDPFGRPKTTSTVFRLRR